MREYVHTLTQNSKYVLSAGFGIILALSVLLIIVWYSDAKETSQKIDTIVNIYNEKTILLSNMRDIARTRVLSLHRLRLLKDPFEIDQELQKFSLLSGKFISNRLKLVELPMNTIELELWAKILPLLNIGQTAQNNAMDFINQKNNSSADLVLFDNVRPAQNNVMKNLTLFLKLQRAASKEALSVIKDANKKTLYTTTLLGTVLILIGILIATLSIRRTSKAEIVLVRASKAAQEANRLKSEFIAKMSHELRTPLNAIIGFSEVLEEEALESKNDLSLKDLKKIQSAGHNLLAIINNVLDISKIESGSLTLHPQEFSIPHLVRNAVASTSALANRNNITIDINLEENMGLMYADELRVRQSLLILLNNACKFSKDGVVSLEAKTLVEPVGLKCLYLKVSDSGIGIDQEQLKILFQPFSQIDASINRRYGGTGLGLVLAKRFCELMDGDLIASSQKGTGSVFTIKLPILTQPEKESIDKLY